MKKYDVAGGLSWMVVGILFCRGSVNLGLGTLGEPGPGFFPFCMSVCLISFSSVHIVSTLRKNERTDLSLERFWPERDGIKKILFAVIPLFMFVLALDVLGFVLCTILFMFFILKFVEAQRWLTTFLVTGLTTGLSYVIFQVWLRANLPPGFWGS